MSALSIHAGPKALAHFREHGLRAQDIAIIPAAAGGPKGMIFQKLDQWLFGHWLPSAPRERTQIGASVGAWRMAAASPAAPAAAIQRHGDLSCEQCYPARPSPQFVSDTCKDFLGGVIGGHEEEILSHPRHRLHILTSRGKRWLHAPRRDISATVGFGMAVLGKKNTQTQQAKQQERDDNSDARD